MARAREPWTKRKVFTNSDIQAMRQIYEEGEGLAVLSKLYGVSIPTVRKKLLKAGCVMRTAGKPSHKVNTTANPVIINRRFNNGK